jgi:hypothetical protein
LDRQSRKIAEVVSSELGVSPYSDKAIKEDDLTDFEQEEVEWSRSVDMEEKVH